MITIDLKEDYPSGRYSLTVRAQGRDRELIHAAAKIIGMPTAAFVRTVVMQAAKQVLDREQVRSQG